MIIFPDLPNVEVEGVEVAEQITLTLRAVLQKRWGKPRWTGSFPFCSA
jgi:hypothetical protein